MSVLAAPDARACSAPQCAGGALVPDQGSTVPVNVPGMLWTPFQGFSGGGAITATDVALVASDGERVAVTLGASVADGRAWVITPNVALRAGATYTLEHPSFCAADPTAPTAIGPVTVGPEAALPTTLGSLSSTDGFGGIEIAEGASCSRLVEVPWVEVTVALSAEAEPWRDVLVWETWVDGRRWTPQRLINRDTPFGSSWWGRGRDRLFTPCGEYIYNGVGLDPGPHTVELRATIPGTSTTLATSPLVVTLSCPGDASDAGVGDAAALERTDDPSSCACVATARATRSATLFALLGLVATIAHRRVRRR
ncbi:hypothetical protein L6R52_31695 [Myxococcota bacterium]|nr:hypothetical protein [Myxococcota bacterium]